MNVNVSQKFSMLIVGILLIGMGVSSNVWAKSSLSRMELTRLIVNEAMQWEVEPALALAVAKVESNFDPQALSRAGARGVMQIMPSTAMGEFGVHRYRLYDPNVNVRLGVRYLRMLLDQYDEDESLALSHYNGGSRVRQSDGSLAVIPATRAYVERVLQQKAHFANHSLVLSAKRGDLDRRYDRLAQADLDDFGQSARLGSVGMPVAVRAEPQHESSERAQLIQALRSLKFKNRVRAVSDRGWHAHSPEPLDDF